MRAPEYVGYWVCENCRAQVWATGVLEDPLSYPPCPRCLIGRMRVDRRAERREITPAPADPSARARSRQ